MAQYVQIPKDLNNVKDKFIGGLTKRQTICFGIGLIIGIGVYLLCTKKFGIDTATACIILFFVVSPFFIIGIYERNGLTIDKMIINFIHYLRTPQIRIYQTENIYSDIEQQIQLDKEMKMIETGKKPVSKNIRK